MEFFCRTEFIRRLSRGDIRGVTLMELGWKDLDLARNFRGRCAYQGFPGWVPEGDVPSVIPADWVYAHPRDGA